MESWRTGIWQQFGAAIDTLGNAIVACPKELWDDGSKPPELFWYSAYHCLFFLDYRQKTGSATPWVNKAE